MGPPADWDTLYGYYGNLGTYTEQLRALEKYSHENPKSAAAHFERAYQYMMMGHGDAAKDQLAEVVKLAAEGQAGRRPAEREERRSGREPMPPPAPNSRGGGPGNRGSDS